MEKRTFNFEVELSEKDERSNIGIVKGYASVYERLDSYDSMMMPGAFDKAIDNFKKNNRLIPMLSSHREAIGGFDPNKIKNKDKKLYVEGQLDLKYSKRTRNV